MILCGLAYGDRNKTVFKIGLHVWATYHYQGPGHFGGVAPLLGSFAAYGHHMLTFCNLLPQPSSLPYIFVSEVCAIGSN